jgi:exosortase
MCTLIFGIFLLTFGSHQEYLFISTLSLVPVSFGLIICLYGSGAARKLSFPILYLLLLVPPPLGILDSVTLPLRHGISVATEMILHAFDYPILRKGLLLTIGSDDIYMGEPCSGFRSLVTLFSLILVYVYIRPGTVNRKIILATCIVPMALLGNLVRVVTLCLITYYLGAETGQGFFHNFSGIMIFIITLLGLMGIETLLYLKNEKI